MAVAAQSALPGEMLYPLKRAIEDAQTGVASGGDAQALSLLDSATSRLSEVSELGREGELTDDAGAVSTTFTDFGTQADRAADLVLADYAETGDRDLVRAAARLHRRQHGHPAEPRAARAGVRPRRAAYAAVEVVSEHRRPGPRRPARAAAAPASTRSRRCCSPRPPPTARSS